MTDEPPPKLPFDIARAGMLLLAALIIGALAMSLIVTLRCTVWFIPACLERPWGEMIRDWLSETIPVLVALILTGRQPPPRQ